MARAVRTPSVLTCWYIHETKFTRPHHTLVQRQLLQHVVGHYKEGKEV